MYSWIASWFTETNNTDEEALYVKYDDINSSIEDWTWIEVIKDESADNFIFIQTSKDCQNTTLERKPKTKRRSRRDILSEQTFRNSLHADSQLFHGPPKSSKRSSVVPVDTMLKTLCKRQLTVSEILSSTFPGVDSYILPRKIEYDIMKLMIKAATLKTLLKLTMRSDAPINGKTIF